MQMEKIFDSLIYIYYKKLFFWIFIISYTFKYFLNVLKDNLFDISI